MTTMARAFPCTTSLLNDLSLLRLLDFCFKRQCFFFISDTPVSNRSQIISILASLILARRSFAARMLFLQTQDRPRTTHGSCRSFRLSLIGVLRDYASLITHDRPTLIFPFLRLFLIATFSLIVTKHAWPESSRQPGPGNETPRSTFASSAGCGLFRGVEL